jgi:hypothetical protein
MPDTIPGSPADDAASLTGLLRDYGALWDITRTPRGFTAKRRPRPTPPVTFTAATVPALRELLQHGHDTRALAAIMRDFAGEWEIEQLDPGSAWVAITRDHAHPQVITAADLGTLRSKLSRTPGGTTELGSPQAAEPGESPAMTGLP